MAASTRWKLWVTLGAALAAAPEAARAGELAAPGGHGLLSALGEYVLVGGGVTDFAEESARDRLDTGGAWDVRLGLGSRSFVGGEVAYVGSFQGGAGARPDLVGNGAEGVLRLQLPWVTGGWLVEPFAFGGVGWTHYTLRDAPAGAEGDDVGTIPFGAGITLGRSGLLLDARFTYRSTFDEDLTLAAGERLDDLDRWSVSASVGLEF